MASEPARAAARGRGTSLVLASQLPSSCDAAACVEPRGASRCSPSGLAGGPGPARALVCSSVFAPSRLLGMLVFQSSNSSLERTAHSSRLSVGWSGIKKGSELGCVQGSEIIEIFDRLTIEGGQAGQIKVGQPTADFAKLFSDELNLFECAVVGIGMRKKFDRFSFEEFHRLTMQSVHAAA